MQIVVSENIQEKILREHNVTVTEVEEAMFLHGSKYIIDDREKHKTHPPTVWFISESFEGRLLKIVIIPDIKREFAKLRTAYEPDEQEIQIYEETK